MIEVPNLSALTTDRLQATGVSPKEDGQRRVYMNAEDAHGDRANLQIYIQLTEYRTKAQQPETSDPELEKFYDEELKAFYKEFAWLKEQNSEERIIASIDGPKRTLIERAKEAVVYSETRRDFLVRHIAQADLLLQDSTRQPPRFDEQEEQMIRKLWNMHRIELGRMNLYVDELIALHENLEKLQSQTMEEKTATEKKLQECMDNVVAQNPRKAKRRS